MKLSDIFLRDSDITKLNDFYDAQSKQGGIHTGYGQKILKDESSRGYEVLVQEILARRQFTHAEFLAWIAGRDMDHIRTLHTSCMQTIVSIGLSKTAAISFVHSKSGDGSEPAVL